MSDIDIERLREATHRLDNDFTLTPDETDELVLAARLLVSLADQGGELWMEKKCPHGMALNYGHDHFLDGHCDGGSRVRAWPPTEGES